MNLPAYNDLLRRGLAHKLFFTEHVPLADLRLVVDFGCADSSLLRALKPDLHPDCKLIGVDASERQRVAAKANFPELDGVYKSLGAALPCGFDGPKLLILSSVMHEALTGYGHDRVVVEWRRIVSHGFDWIAIRDMEPGNVFPRSSLNGYFMSPNRRRGREASFEAAHGSLYQPANLLHYLLKEPYAEDWERENGEDYFAADLLTASLALMPDYAATFVERTTLPSFRERLLRVHGVALEDHVTTHYAAVFKRVP